MFIYCVNNGESRRRGAAGSRWRTCADGFAQGGGAVWRRGYVDGRPDKVIALISPEDGYAEDGGSNFSACAVVCVECWLDRLVLPSLLLGGLLNPPDLDDVRWCVRSEHLAPISPPPSSRL